MEMFSGPCLAGGLRATEWERSIGHLPQALISDCAASFDSVPYRRQRLQKFGRRLKTPPGIFIKEHFDEADDRLRNALEFLKRQRSVLMLRHHFGGTTPKGHMTGQHLPERNTKRVEIRTDVHLSSYNLFRTGELRCSGKGAGRRDRGLSTGFIDRLGQAEIDNLGRHSALVLKAHHDIAWLDVPVNELFLVHRSQAGGDLHRNLQSALYVQAVPSA